MSAAIFLSMSLRGVMLLASHVSSHLPLHVTTGSYAFKHPWLSYLESDLQWRVHPLTCLHNALEGTTLRALRYYLSSLKTIQLCGSLHPSSAPPMVSWDFSLGTTLRALRYYLSGLKVIGSITGVRLLIDTFPEVGFGPCLTVDIHHGNGMGLCSRGSYNQGAYTCLLACPNGGTLLAVWTFQLLVQPHKEEKEKMKAKSE
ncbi:hypothetical protein CK203_089343 [Vitis vinifera]|uniref:Uncharacterized protein n=1 Tax=Vitis vinifera TaxID=29760 RepID=A0A438D2X7_VITVI|nr:hypothetical protein CK203_089343 [Vitis vinifera]